MTMPKSKLMATDWLIKWRCTHKQKYYFYFSLQIYSMSCLFVCELRFIALGSEEALQLATSLYM